jgi:hypothetical protein
MALKEGQDYLHEDGPNPFLAERLILFSRAPDELAKVAACAVLHNDIEGCIALVKDFVVVPHNVLMPELPQDVDL